MFRAGDQHLTGALGGGYAVGADTQVRPYGEVMGGWRAKGRLDRERARKFWGVWLWCIDFVRGCFRVFRGFRGFRDPDVCALMRAAPSKPPPFSEDENGGGFNAWEEEALCKKEFLKILSLRDIIGV
jgi:hypothetical protein